VTILEVISNPKAKLLSSEICPRERDHFQNFGEKRYMTQQNNLRELSWPRREEKMSFRLIISQMERWLVFFLL